MRIAVSGTHCSGKTTLIEEFLRAHPDFVHEPEAYTVMVEDYGEEFSSERDFFRQLEFIEQPGVMQTASESSSSEAPDYLAYGGSQDLNRTR